jgi:tRNA-dihydrouridine synthase
MSHIWQSFQKPIFILAPMEDVTDTVFRRIVAKTGAPDIFFTEFVNVGGLVTRGRRAASRRLIHTEGEQPLIAQIWGEDPETFRTIARELASGEFGPFVGIDLNMGCPERKVVKRGSCAGLIGRPDHAIEIIRATKEGAGDLPVSVKTRCGINDWVTEEWATTLLNQDLAALTIHGRIAREKSTFPARWEEIAKVVALRDKLGTTTPIIGNGDVSSYQDGLDKVVQYGVDGVMVGRGIFRNLWFFDPAIDPATITLAERVALLAEHIRWWKESWGGDKNFEALKKFYKAYFYNVPNMGELQRELMLLHTPDETLARLALVPTERQPDMALAH